ncbi:CpG-binding protein [Myotis davidii]|uniref:CXXC-type zinc finger protein 1 n=1 Tax=Myotis davidii TaxID=225400 RepID=L5LD32_MYODS|nr:CpG-binding protein [Myotis davidii]
MRTPNTFKKGRGKGQFRRAKSGEVAYLEALYSSALAEKEKKQKLVGKRKHAETMDVQDPAVLRQCLGPHCVNPNRPGSKYCSDDCGMNLAAVRIYEILPQRIQQWQNSPSVAEEHSKKMLENILREQQDVHTHLKYLEGQYHELEAIILRGKQQAICKDEEVSGNRATRLFCDVYDPTSERYCKRLQVLCPEHSKDPKVSSDEVCGCPLVHNVFEPTGNFCCLPKCLCIHHYCWEKLRRAEVDLERVRALYKLELLSEQEHKVRTSMRNRTGLLGLMLHQTIQHDPLTNDLRSREDN